MAQEERPDLHTLMTELHKLSAKVDDLKKQIDHAKEPKNGGDLAFAAALLPLCGLTSFGFGNPLFLPFGLRLAAARVLVIQRALERAAKISGELAKAGAGTTHKSDRMEQLLDWVVEREPKDREALVKFMRAFWREE
jgi:hypothetical protein